MEDPVVLQLREDYARLNNFDAIKSDTKLRLRAIKLLHGSLRKKPNDLLMLGGKVTEKNQYLAKNDSVHCRFQRKQQILERKNNVRNCPVINFKLTTTKTHLK